jgi:hypothetical protein
MQILCAVGVLRAMSFVPPPLLDGVGKPSHTLLYMIVASIVVPISFVVGAEVLGPRYQEVSVAIAWAVSYPVAFAVLAVLALRQIGMTAGGYLRRLIGIPICAALATGASALVHWPLAGRAPDAVTLVVTGGVMIGLFLLLLAYFQGISPRSVARAIKGDPPSVHEAV